MDLRKLRCAALLVVVFQCTHVWTMAQDDTLRYRTKVVQVETARIDIQSQLSRSRQRRLSDTDIVALNTRQSAELLRYIPGVLVRDYGGLGGVKTVSLRGATAAQTGVILDGVRLNSSQNGLFDFSTLPSAFIESISVNDASEIQVSNANALGGVVMIQGHMTRDSIAHCSVNGSLGSWNEQSIEVQVACPLGSSRHLNASFSRRVCDGDYTFRFNDFAKTSEFRRVNADYQDANATVLFHMGLPHVDLSTRIMLRTSQRGAPDAVTQGNVEHSSARLHDDDLLVIQRLELREIIRGKTSVSLFTKFNTQSYTDSSRKLLGVAIRNLFYARDGGLSVNHSESVFLGDQIHFGAELSYADVRGDLLRLNSGQHVSRSSVGAGVGYQSQGIAITESLSATLVSGLRFDAFSDASAFWTPRLAVLVHVEDHLEVKFQYTRTFRLPSFNELYYQNYGSTSLRPERSQSFKIGIEYSLKNDRMELMVDSVQEIKKPSPSHVATGSSAVSEPPWLSNFATSLDVFVVETNDQIIATPRSPISWTATNIAEVRTMGAEFGCMVQVKSHSSVRCGYTFQDVRDNRRSSIHYGRRIVYSPQHIAFVSLNTRLEPVLFGLNIQATSRRFTQTDNDLESSLPAFVTVNLNVAYLVHLFDTPCQLRVDIDNCLNEEYSVISNYPMPGRLIRLGFGVQL